MSEYLVYRAYFDTLVQAKYGRTIEIMKEIIDRSLRV